MKKILALAVVLVAILMVPAFADDVTVGNLSEGKTGRFDYGMTYIVGNTTVEGVPVRLQLDLFSQPAGYRRVWLNAGAIELAKGDLSASFSPGIIVDNRDRWWVGGTLVAEYKPAGLTLIYKPAAGNRGDRHLAFTSLRVTDWLAIRHSFYTQRGMSPDSYLGPAITLGKNVWIWGGPSLNRPGAWTLDASATIKF